MSRARIRARWFVEAVRWMSTAGLLVLLGGGPPPAWSQGPPAELHAWVGLGPDGVIVARVITDADRCPSITLDGAAAPMALRAGKSQDFPVLTCEATVPAGTKRARVGSTTLPLPAAQLRRIAVIGDSGCRLKAKDNAYQACDDPVAWPFATVARAVAAYKPDLVLHVGDYFYRESPCPAGTAGCAGSLWGNNWPAWKADFFAPAAPALAAAPWIFVRGNHEDCGRAWQGWFRFLDPRGASASCPRYTEPYAVSVAGLQFLVLDTSAMEWNVTNAQVREFGRQLAAVRQLAAADAWLTMHHPLWAFAYDKDADSQVQPVTATLQKASKNGLPSGVQLVVTGHIHIFEALGFDDRRAPNVVVGVSGTQLDHEIPTPLVGLKLAGATVAAASTAAQFGFVTVEFDEGDPVLTRRDMRGNPRVICRADHGELSCQPAKD